MKEFAINNQEAQTDDFKPVDQIKQEIFENKEQILNILHNGKINIISLIDERIKVSEHANRVELVFLNTEHLNGSVLFEISDGDKTVLAVYKPVSGERHDDPEIPIRNFAIREELAYQIDQNFGFNFVPPTVIREEGDSFGSLQLFIEEPYTEGAMLDSVQQDITELSDDYMKMALFDSLILGLDRKDSNYLVNAENPESVILIDHGMSMDSSSYKNKHVRGPLLQMTWDNVSQKAKKTKLSDELISILKQGLDKKEQFQSEYLNQYKDQYSAEFPDFENEMNKFWIRVEETINRGYLISKYNCPELF